MAPKGQSGQALVLVLLSLSVVLTLVLYILSRSVTDVSVSSGQSDSTRAFSAAEAGVEQALVVGSSSNADTRIGGAGAKYTTIVTDFAMGGNYLIYPTLLSSGDTATVWFVGHDANGNLNLPNSTKPWSSMQVCWGNTGSTAAVEVSVYYEQTLGDLSTVRIARAAFDANASSRGNGFAGTSGNCTINGTSSYAYSANTSLVNTSGLLFAKIRMLYGTSQPVGVTVTGESLPSQGKQIDSRGVAGESNRRIVVYQGWAEFPFASNAILDPTTNGLTE